MTTTTTTPMTVAQRQAAYRQRLRDLGLIAVTVYVRPAQRVAVRALEAELRRATDDASPGD